MLNYLAGIFGSHNARLIRKYRKIVDDINALADETARLSDQDLANKTVEFKARLTDGKTLDDILPEAFAVVRETATRILGMRHFDVQLIGGIALHNGQIAEMKTGEGKTLVATSAVYLNALAGKGVHVVTVNDYLAKRDSEWMGRVYRFLGLSVGVVIGGMSDSRKKEAYLADITYGTNHEFGFDYLRDNLKFNESEMVMRPFHFAVIDEVDSILIDEARTPLIISGPDDNASDLYVAVDSVIKKIGDGDFEKDEKNRNVTLTDQGVERVEEGLREIGILKGDSLYDPSNITIVYHVNCALRANKVFTRDIDYMVRNGQVLIIDEFTGRIMDGRRYSEGLHQALEAKEGVKVQTESQTVATISYQNLFRLYPKIAGMTGTAMTEEAEFEEIYKLRVVSIPPNVPVKRTDLEDSMYVTMAEKDRAIVALIKECCARKQPVLVGTTNLERSEYLSKMLVTEGIKHNVLNAKQHEREAYVIAEAGTPGTVTIATNMAGRGTDIKLGGSLEMRIDLECAGIADPDELNQKVTLIKEDIERKKAEVIKSGGLFVIGTERNESRRIDNQLRGRSGRQGDPGMSKYFISLEDDLMKRFGSANLTNRFRKLCKNDEELSFRWMSKAIEKAQQRVEAYNFDIRKQLLKYDDVMNDQRKMVYEQRRILMQTDDVSEHIQDMIDDVLDHAIDKAAPQGTVPIEWNVQELADTMKRVFKIDINVDEIANDSSMTRELLRQNLGDMVETLLKERDEKLGTDTMRYVEKEAALKTLDLEWRNHLVVLEHLRRGINLRSYAQKNPLNEYKFEAFNIFRGMLHKVQIDVLTTVFGYEFDISSFARTAYGNEYDDDDDYDYEHTADAENEADVDVTNPGENSVDNSRHVPEEPSVESQLIQRNVTTYTTRNAICNCGSGKRYKHCCGQMKPLHVVITPLNESVVRQQVPEPPNNSPHDSEGVVPKRARRTAATTKRITARATKRKNSEPATVDDKKAKPRAAKTVKKVSHESSLSTRSSNKANSSAKKPARTATAKKKTKDDSSTTLETPATKRKPRSAKNPAR
ncbi:MAG: preprotein translocase subunit SecA [Holosporales bacterium]|jgi:preprotein translocase subunit SecA|nr:preprotein translocase subunit SecA [Holosporales bacterium]